MVSLGTELHFVLIPFVAQGHLIPMVDIARILAERGVLVTIITTPVNANRCRPVLDRAIEAKLRIQMVEIQFPVAEVGLPEGCESLDLARSVDQNYKLFEAIGKLEGPAESVIINLSPAPSCIISDNLFPWTRNLARRFHIPSLVFHAQSCFTFVCLHFLSSTNILDRIKSYSEKFLLPGLPDPIEFTKPQASAWPNGGEMGESDGIVFNSCEDLEPEYVKEYSRLTGKKIWSLGPVSLSYKNNHDMAVRGNKAGYDEHDCLKWLDSKEPESVLLVCLGSQAEIPGKQVIELGLGLELSNRPFIWCIKNKTEEVEKWLSEERFEERVKDRGLIVHGWAPQILILANRAIGGFLTHCGWNSVLEAVCAGVPMATWPHFGDHAFNEKFIIHVLKVGVSLGANDLLGFFQDDKDRILVKKEDVQTALNKLMGEGEEAKVISNRAKELAETAKRAMETGGSSHRNVTSMIQDVTERFEKLAKNIIDSNQTTAL